jgi:hypothetical protein
VGKISAHTIFAHKKPDEINSAQELDIKPDIIGGNPDPE